MGGYLLNPLLMSIVWSARTPFDGAINGHAIIIDDSSLFSWTRMLLFCRQARAPAREEVATESRDATYK